MKKKVLSVSLVLLLAISMVVVGCGGSSQEQAAKEFYKGKTITFYTAVPGSGMHLMSLFIAEHLGKALEATVVVEPFGEIGGLKSYNELWLAPKDGLYMAGHNLTTVWQNWVFKEPVAVYDADQLIYLGSVLSPPMTIWTNAKGNYTTIAALKAGKGLIGGGASPLGYVTFWQALALHWLGTDAQVLVGIGGPGPLKESLLLDETQFTNIGCHWTETFGVPFYPDLQPVVVLSGERTPIFEDVIGIDVPALTEVVTIPAEEALWFELMETAGRYLMPGLAFAPGVPQDRVDYMRKVLQEVATDPAVIKAANEEFGEWEWETWQDVEQGFAFVKDHIDDYNDIRTLIEANYIVTR